MRGAGAGNIEASSQHLRGFQGAHARVVCCSIKWCYAPHLLPEKQIHRRLHTPPDSGSCLRGEARRLELGELVAHASRCGIVLSLNSPLQLGAQHEAARDGIDCLLLLLLLAGLQAAVGRLARRVCAFGGLGLLEELLDFLEVLRARCSLGRARASRRGGARDTLQVSVRSIHGSLERAAGARACTHLLDELHGLLALHGDGTLQLSAEVQLHQEEHHLLVDGTARLTQRCGRCAARGTPRRAAAARRLAAAAAATRSAAPRPRRERHADSLPPSRATPRLPCSRTCATDAASPILPATPHPATPRRPSPLNAAPRRPAPPRATRRTAPPPRALCGAPAPSRTHALTRAGAQDSSAPRTKLNQARVSKSPPGQFLASQQEQPRLPPTGIAMHEGFWRVPASLTPIHRHPPLSFVVVVPGRLLSPDRRTTTDGARHPTDRPTCRRMVFPVMLGAGARLGGWLARAAAANQPPNWRERTARALARASRDHTVSISNRAEGVCARACMRMCMCSSATHTSVGLRGAARTAELAPVVGGGAAGGKTQGRHVGKTAGGRHTRAGARTVPPPPPLRGQCHCEPELS